ncbi:MAG TPA: hypothetical protein VJT67_05930 [Longimicrobiaceae bacterium]|nr:hypothetical protein [Longimicrobiaceae bacterium]
MPKLTLRSATAALAGILIAIGGCTESPLTPAGGEMLTRSHATRFDVSGTASEVIGPAGGMLVTPAGDRLIFPAGVLAEPTRITLTSSNANVSVEIEPHGLQFAAGRQPVLVLNTQGSNAGSFRRVDVSYLDDSGAILEILPSMAGGGTISTTLQHFSTYAAFGGLIATGH